MRKGPRNLITDVAGLRVGNAEDARVLTGSTVLVGDAPFTAAVHVMGGAPGTRETDLLAPDKTVQQVDALVLSGGSAFGLDAASGVADGLRAAGRGFDVGGQKVPIVPAAILFDLLNGGQKEWAENPYKSLGKAALDASAEDFALGASGAGIGATTATGRGGLGSASLVLPGGQTVGALVAVNALGSPTVGESQHFWAAPFELDGEFGGLGPAPAGAFDPLASPRLKGGPGENTTIGIVATDATLTQAGAQRMATAAHDGYARALYPSHTPFDGDLIFGVSTGVRPLADPVADPILLGHAAALCMARAIARGVYEAN
ncbi:P1 family peptidase [Pseudoruegeria sp. SHC-113]|uniref:P1 family peptidase n=1 Tax=Pseudoruegeria sp. SHC-113 TaxID=2855439 RepID=UPI0021BB50B5|nr:P1 family peptidase [Pseudoruegeria sp. SHC-113]MCT8159229.1 P1 family peptidase [Pseudoruegeria sp. SHC-113]